MGRQGTVNREHACRRALSCPCRMRQELDWEGRMSAARCSNGDTQQFRVAAHLCLRDPSRGRDRAARIGVTGDRGPRVVPASPRRPGRESGIRVGQALAVHARACERARARASACAGEQAPRGVLCLRCAWQARCSPLPMTTALPPVHRHSQTRRQTLRGLFCQAAKRVAFSAAGCGPGSA